MTACYAKYMVISLLYLVNNPVIFTFYLNIY